MTELRSRATLKADDPRSTEDWPRPTLGFVVLMAVVAVYGLHALFISGPAARVAAQQHLERTIAGEDLDVCGRLGIRPESSQFTVCSGELAIVRRKQSEREKAAGQGIL